MSTYSSFSDADLFILISKGDKTAFAVLYDRYFDLLYVHALQKLNDTDVAKDLVQELFTTVWIRRKDVQMRDVKPYLYRGIKNKILDHLAKEKIRWDFAEFQRYSVVTGATQDADYRIREMQLAKQIDDSIAMLPDKMRKVFEMSRKEYLNNRDIAIMLNISEQTVKKQVNNALRILKRRFG